jgi:hypothetical protein
MANQALRFIGLWRVRALALLASAGLGLALAATVLLLARPRAALAAPNALSYPSGSAPCDTTLQACINGAAPGDTINIAAGLYVTSVTLNQAVNLVGAGVGGGGTFLQALAGQRVITVTGAVTPSTQIASMTIQNGSAAAARPAARAAEFS